MSTSVAHTDDYFEKVASGRIPRYSGINKFGRYENVGSTEVIVAVDGVYGLPTSSDTVTVTSDDLADVLGGDGARTVLLQGLDADGLEASEIVDMNGTSNIKFFRVFRARVWTAGTVTPIAGGNVGTITIAQTGGTEMVKIGPNKGQTQCCCYTIPANKKGLLWHASGTSSEGKNVDFRILSRLAHDDACFAVQGEKDAFEGEAGDDFKIPTEVPALTDLVVTGKSSASGANLSADMQIELITV